MDKWPEVEFGTLYEISSRNGLSKPSRVRGSGYKMINMGELFSNDRLYDIGMELVPLTALEKVNAKVEVGDLLFARQSLVAAGAGKCSIVLETSELTVFESHIIRVRLKRTEADPLFYYYYFKSPCSTMRTIIEHCVQAGIKATDLAKLKVPVPPLGIQRNIRKILSVIDDKIEENNRINKNLSNLLQAIYQKRFGEVSLGAKQGILSDICSYSKEKVAVSELNVNTYFSTENMLPEKAGSTKATSLPTTPQTTACRKDDTLISNIRPYFKKIVYCEDMCGCSTDVLCFTPIQSQYAAYLFSTLYTDKFFAFMVAGSKGTKMPRGDKQQIMRYPVVVPAESELEEFNAIAFPVLEQLNSNKAENKRLSALRDALLPKLMSGEIDISAIDL